MISGFALSATTMTWAVSNKGLPVYAFPYAVKTGILTLLKLLTDTSLASVLRLSQVVFVSCVHVIPVTLGELALRMYMGIL